MRQETLFYNCGLQTKTGSLDDLPFFVAYNTNFCIEYRLVNEKDKPKIVIRFKAI